MNRQFDELPVTLDELDDHLKALLRLKIREFVHLSTCFENVPLVDLTNQELSARVAEASRVVTASRESVAPRQVAHRAFTFVAARPERAGTSARECASVREVASSREAALSREVIPPSDDAKSRDVVVTYRVVTPVLR